MATSCQACRLSALRLFLNPLSPARAARTQFRKQQLRESVARFFTFKPTLPLRHGPAIEERREQETVTGQEAGDQDAPASGVNEGAPWYLQVEPPRHPTLIHEPPPLPDVPEGSPKLVAPLLKFTAEDLGLDDLKLLDLREIDPPAALGPDLMMLFGTARSERHLHVSADRLVRWLRDRGISASADGLLGRNELKIKLRRKARKAKLLGGAASAIQDADDGISTGWVCVNLGTVGASTKEITKFDESGNVIGFGVQGGGTTLVVQMFVESRRTALNLEKLWSGILKRSLAKNAEIQGIPAPTDNDVSSNSTPSSTPRGHRFFSTSARRTVDAHGGTILQRLLAGQSQDGMDINAVDDALTHDIESKMKILEQLKRHLTALPLGEAVAELTPSDDGKPSRFERLLEHALRNLPEQEVWNWRLWLKTEAAMRNAGHFNYDLDSLQELVTTMQLSRLEVTREQFLGLFKAVYAKAGENDDVVRKQSTIAMQVIDTMFYRGLSVLEHDVIVTVLESLLLSGARGAEASRLLMVFEQLLKQADLPCPSPKHLLRLLDAYASQGKWEKFWDVWRIPPRHAKSRAPEMYTYVFRRLAEDNDQKRCREALRFCVPEMPREIPPVPATGLLVDALKDCIRVADPHAEQIAKTVVPKDMDSIKMANREFVKLFKKLGVGPESGW